MPKPATDADALADAGRAGEADHVDVGRGHQGLGGLRALADHDVDHAGREAGLGEQLAQAHDGQRDPAGPA